MTTRDQHYFGSVIGGTIWGYPVCHDPEAA